MTELGQLVHDPWEKRGRRKAIIHEFVTITVESDLSELQLSEHVSYLNTPTISGYFCVKLALNIQNGRY